MIGLRQRTTAPRTRGADADQPTDAAEEPPPHAGEPELEEIFW